jgi:heme A synthase
VPDWPLSLGRLIPPLEGGIRYEFAHRALAATVAILIGVQAFWVRRNLAWAAFAAVLAQALLGGALVKLIDPKWLAIAHACLGQLCFGLTVAVAVEGVGSGGDVAAWLAVVALFGQTVLGAAVRHKAIGLTPHIVGAVIATAVVMWACLGVLMRHMEEARLRRPAMALLYTTGAQVFLGLAAYTALQATADAPQPMPLMVWATVAHVVMGSVVFGAAIVLAMVLRRSVSRGTSI